MFGFARHQAAQGLAGFFVATVDQRLHGVEVGIVAASPSSARTMPAASANSAKPMMRQASFPCRVTPKMLSCQMYVLRVAGSGPGHTDSVMSREIQHVQANPCPQSVCLGPVGLAASAWADEAGKVVLSVGEVRVQGQAVKAGHSVQAGDRLSTGADGYVYIKTVDNGF